MYKHDAVVRAWLDGETIQYQLHDGTWVDAELSHPSIADYVPAFFNSASLRVKPAPVVLWCVLRMDGSVLKTFTDQTDAVDCVEVTCNALGRTYRVAKMVEQEEL